MEVLKGDVIKSIANKLAEIFEDYHIYKEPVNMNFNVPALFINCDKAQIKKAYGTRYYINFDVSIFCYADITKNIEALEDARAKIIDGFDYLTIGGKKVGVSNKSFDMEDKSLKINFKLGFHIMRQKDKELMGTLIEKKLKR